MEDKRNFVLPEASEKLSFRFILDSVKEQMIEEQLESHSETVEIQAAPPSEEICGTPAEKTTAPLEIITESLERSEEENTLDTLKFAPLPEGKKYFRIGEVASLLQVEPYVLRYWETEFKTIKPVKAGSGHRVYSRKDVETLQLIKHLLYNEKFSIKGAKKKLSEKKKEVKVLSQPNTVILKEIAVELKEIVNFLRANSI